MKKEKTGVKRVVLFSHVTYAKGNHENVKVKLLYGNAK